MTSERKQILELLAAGKVSVEEAERLLQLTAGDSSAASGTGSASATSPRVSNPKFIRIMVEPVEGADSKQPLHHVNIRVPLKIVRAGVNLASLIPGEAGQIVQGSLLEKGFNSDITKLSGSALDELIEALQELSIDATVDNHTVKVFVE
ncbi:MAG: hypothetical protein O7E57_00925 [Gammaproteobacteria bacterium]|nr:hypothetical protein [Gammaproteobacteria bacterium]